MKLRTLIDVIGLYTEVRITDAEFNVIAEAEALKLSEGIIYRETIDKAIYNRNNNIKKYMDREVKLIRAVENKLVICVD